jgi:hypothetical protein
MLIAMRGVIVLGLVPIAACASSAGARETAPSAAARPSRAEPAAKTEPAPGDKSVSVDTRDETAPAFQTDFPVRDIAEPWNIFGAREGNRMAFGGPEGLWLKIARGEKAWDAVGIRTNRIEVDGDFDLRAGFRDFSGLGNASAKLLVIDAKGRPGDSVYVERAEIDGKSLLKWGGDVQASSENWGFVPSDIASGELRLVRKGSTFLAYARPNDSEMWSQIGPPQPVPRSTGTLAKFGVRLSTEAGKSAQVRWAWLTMRGHVIPVQ